MFDVYVEMVEANKKIQTPSNFHHWVLRNYAYALALCIRKLADTNKDAVSLRGLIGAVANNPSVITRRAFLGRYPAHHRDVADRNWATHCGGSSPVCLPREIAHFDLQVIDRIARDAVTYVNKEIAHHERGRRFRTLRLDKVHRALDELLRLLAKYGDLCGRPVPCPYSIQDASDWTQIFRRSWLE